MFATGSSYRAGGFVRAGFAAFRAHRTGLVMQTTTSPHEHDLSSPFWTLGHLAQALSITTARHVSTPAVTTSPHPFDRRAGLRLVA